MNQVPTITESDLLTGEAVGDWVWIEIAAEFHTTLEIAGRNASAKRSADRRGKVISVGPEAAECGIEAGDVAYFKRYAETAATRRDFERHRKYGTPRKIEPRAAHNFEVRTADGIKQIVVAPLQNVFCVVKP